MPTYCSTRFPISTAAPLIRSRFAYIAPLDRNQVRIHVDDLRALEPLYEASHFSGIIQFVAAAPASTLDEIRTTFRDFAYCESSCWPDMFATLVVIYHHKGAKSRKIDLWETRIKVSTSDTSRTISASLGCSFSKSAADVRRICESIGERLQCMPIFEDVSEGLHISWPGWDELANKSGFTGSPDPGTVWKSGELEVLIPLTEVSLSRVPDMLHWFLTEHATPGYRVGVSLNGRGPGGTPTTESFNRVLEQVRTFQASYEYAALQLEPGRMKDIGALHFLERNMSEKDQYHIGLGEIQCGKRAVPLRLVTMRHRSYLLLQPKAALTAEELAEAGRIVGAEFLPEPISSGKDPLSKTPVLRSDGFYSLENEYCRGGIRYYVPDDATVAVPRGTTPENSRSAAAVFLDFSPRHAGHPVPETVAYDYAEIGRKLIRRMKKLYGVVLDFSPEALAVADRLIDEHYPALPPNPYDLRQAARAWKKHATWKDIVNEVELLWPLWQAEVARQALDGEHVSLIQEESAGAVIRAASGFEIEIPRGGADRFFPPPDAKGRPGTKLVSYVEWFAALRKKEKAFLASQGGVGGRK